MARAGDQRQRHAGSAGRLRAGQDDRGQADGDHRQYDQRQRRLVHGEQRGVSRYRSQRTTSKAGDRRTGERSGDTRMSTLALPKFELKMGAATRDAYGKALDRKSAA